MPWSYTRHTHTHWALKLFRFRFKHRRKKHLSFFGWGMERFKLCNGRELRLMVEGMSKDFWLRHHP